MKATNTITTSTPQDKKKTFSTFITGEAITNRINQLASSKEEGTQFIASLVAAVTTTPALQDCTHMSILNCGLQCLALKLSPTPQMGQFVFLPFRNNNEGTVIATPVIGYKGYVQLAMRSGYYKKIIVLALREGEVAGWNPLEEELTATLIEDEDEREQTPIAGFYGFFEYHNGFRKSMYWNAGKMRNHAKRYSAAYRKDLEKNTANTLWSTDFEGMGNKTILRQLISRWGIMSTDMQRAFEIENETNTQTTAFVETDTTVEDDFFNDTPKKGEKEKAQSKPPKSSAEQKPIEQNPNATLHSEPIVSPPQSKKKPDEPPLDVDYAELFDDGFFKNGSTNKERELDEL